MKINPDDPAAPCKIKKGSGTTFLSDIEKEMPGMTIRTQLAAMAMQGLLTRQPTITPYDAAEMGVLAADFLIKELNKETNV